MTAILAILSEIWPFLIAAAGGLLALFSHMSAKATKAKAAATEADARRQISEVVAYTEKQNAAAAQQGADAAQERTNVENSIAAAGGSADRLRNAWSRD